MHFFLVAILPLETELDDVEDALEHMMERYDENRNVPPYKVYLDTWNLRRMREHYQVDDDRALVTHLRDWCGCRGGYDEGGLYKCTTSNPDGKWDWYEIGGRWAGEMRGVALESNDGGCNVGDQYHRPEDNTILVGKIDYHVTCYALLTPDGEWHQGEREWHFDEQGEFVIDDEETRKEKNARWQQWADETLPKYREHLAVGVDYHN